MRKRTSLFITAVFIITFSCCTLTKPPIKTTVTFISGKVTRNNLPINVGELIKTGDTISTSSRSLAVLQFDMDAFILISSNTTIKIASLISGTKQKAVLIQQLKGNTFNKVVKNRLSYYIGTATMTAAVRGTAFSVYIDPVSNVSRIKLLEGRVQLRSGNFLGDMEKQLETIPPHERSSTCVQEAELTQGFEIDGTKDGLSRPLPIEPKEIARMNDYNSVSMADLDKQIAPVAGMEKKDSAPEGPERKSLIIIPESIEKKLLQLDSGIDPFNIGENGFVNTETALAAKLETIKRKNQGKLDVIKLSNGKELRGMIIERGPVYKVETPEGIRLIDRNDIISQTIKF